MIVDLLPTITDHIPQLTKGLAQRQLDLEVHRRKWNLVIHGIESVAKEEDEVTHGICKGFAHTVLKVRDAKETVFAACHRLSSQPNAGIIVRFMDFAQRDRWLASTMHLKNHSGKVSISPYLPPVLRPLKDELMKERSNLPAQIKQKSLIEFLSQWPFVKLKIDGQLPKRSSVNLCSVTAVTAKMLNVNPLLVLRGSNEPLPPSSGAS